MTKEIIKIDENKCIGCGICAKTCQKSAIEMVNGKAKVVRESSCDGIGRCLPLCPVNAITFETVNVQENTNIQNTNIKENNMKNTPHQCPGSNNKPINREPVEVSGAVAPTRLNQWPVQIKLVNETAPYFSGSHLLIAADCAAYAYGDFHKEFIKNRITLIGCPKLDNVDYTEKLTNILKNNDIKSLTIVRMEVPCCKGIVDAAVKALKDSGKFIPWQIAVISTDGVILED